MTASTAPRRDDVVFLEAFTGLLLPGSSDADLWMRNQGLEQRAIAAATAAAGWQRPPYML